MFRHAKSPDGFLTRIEAGRVSLGIITALPKEYAAMQALLENARERSVPGQGTGRRYLLGEIPAKNGYKHSVVLMLLPDMGNNAAAVGATLLLEYFLNVSSIIMVGIAGGVPNPHKPDEHVRLGDIVVSNRNGVVQYDYSKETETEIIHRQPPRPPSSRLLEAVRFLEAAEIKGERPWLPFIDQAIRKLNKKRPDEAADALADPVNSAESIKHPQDAAREKNRPRVFYGPIASANLLLKNAKKRDELRDRFGVKAIEMEGSGVADATWNQEAGYLVVRGICDYCDARKNDDWQDYAAIVAAAYTRALIEMIHYQPESGSSQSSGRRLAAAVILVCMIILGLVALIDGQRIGTQNYNQKYQVYVSSKVLPVEVYYDGIYQKTLDNITPATTIETNEGKHNILAKWNQFEYEERISLTEDTSPCIVIISRASDLQ